MKKFYITTAIDYTSQKPHIGNNYEKVYTDVVARFKRLDGFDVYFQTGTDEHGQKVKENAKLAGKAPLDFVNEISQDVKRASDILNVSYDAFVRTIDKQHVKSVQDIFKYLYDKGDIYLGTYEGFYCLPCESYFLEKDLIENTCPDCNREVINKKEEAYFFRLSKYEKRLLKYIEENEDFIKPESKKREMINNFIKEGLQDLCVSRSTVDWGIKVPFNNKHVIYVWIDALSNYITFLGYDINGNHSERFKKYWPADYHIVGKDITRFHTIYWPILLMALDLKLPKTIYGHPWLTMDGGKISKSTGNVIYAEDLLKYFHVDMIRYFLIKEVPYQNDGNMSFESLIDVVNLDLINTLGNLVSRTNAMVIKYFNGVVPKPVQKEKDQNLIKYAEELYINVSKKIDDCKLSDSLDLIMELFRKSNKYIDENEPWILAKDKNNDERLGTVLYNLLECIRIGTVLLKAYIPSTAEAILKKINTSERSFNTIKSYGNYKPSTIITDKEVLFKRIDKDEKLKEIS